MSTLSFLAMLIKGRNDRDLYLASSDRMVVQKKEGSCGIDGGET
jgi:hypothetical protein